MRHDPRAGGECVPNRRLGLRDRAIPSRAKRYRSNGSAVSHLSTVTATEVRKRRMYSSSRKKLERATLGWRRGRDRVTLGKQTIAWGVFDGLQVTDRYDPVRRHDAVLGDVRPERIARSDAR